LRFFSFKIEKMAEKEQQLKWLQNANKIKRSATFFMQGGDSISADSALEAVRSLCRNSRLELPSIQSFQDPSEELSITQFISFLRVSMHQVGTQRVYFFAQS